MRQLFILHDSCWRSGGKERHSQSGVKPPHSKESGPFGTPSPRGGYTSRVLFGQQQDSAGPVSLRQLDGLAGVDRPAVHLHRGASAVGIVEGLLGHLLPHVVAVAKGDGVVMQRRFGKTAAFDQ